MPLTLFTAPLTLYLIFKHYNTPISITSVKRWRFVVAALLAIAQLIAIGFTAYFWFFRTI